MTEHTIAMAQGNRVTCTCGQVFTAPNRTDALVQLLDHVERAEAQDVTENIRRLGRIEHLSRHLLATVNEPGDLVAHSVTDAIREYVHSGGDLGQLDIVVRSEEEPAGLRVELKGWSA